MRLQDVPNIVASAARPLIETDKRCWKGSSSNKKHIQALNVSHPIVQGERIMSHGHHFSIRIGMYSTVLGRDVGQRAPPEAVCMCMCVCKEDGQVQQAWDFSVSVLLAAQQRTNVDQ